MRTCEKLRRIRQHRKMTQKELGDAVGLTANRIAQYEMGYREPKAPLLERMAEALRVSKLALLEPNAGNLGSVMETLFWVEEELPGVFHFTTIEFDDPDRAQDTSPYADCDARLHGDLTIPMRFAPPTVLWTENGLLDKFFRKWGEMQAALYHGEITRKQYFEWKLCWPDNDAV